MTPTEQDKELSKLLAYIDGSSDYNGAWFGEIPDGKTGTYWWRSELKKLITADRKRVALEARIDELKKVDMLTKPLLPNSGSVETNVKAWVKDRLPQLKAQQEKK